MAGRSPTKILTVAVSLMLVGFLWLNRQLPERIGSGAQVPAVEQNAGLVADADLATSAPLTAAAANPSLWALSGPSAAAVSGANAGSATGIVVPTYWIGPVEASVTQARSLATLNRGDRFELPVAGGGSLTARVTVVATRPDGTIRVAGDVEGADVGKFILAENAQGLSGRILLTEKRLAYQVSSLAGAGATIQAGALSGIICYPLPPDPNPAPVLAPGLPESVPPPNLSSRPSATAVLYLDFDGQTVTDTDWTMWNGGNTIVAQPSPLTELQMTEVWNRVKEDFSPFNIDVTTNVSRYAAVPAGRRMHVIITPTKWYGNVGGVAYVNSFSGVDQSGYQFEPDVVSWVFNATPATIADAVSHELGHTLGLEHDGDLSQTVGSSAREYYSGHGSGVSSWGPIMGAPYGRSIAQWSKGEYPNANNQEDDLAIIAKTANGFGYLPDDAGDSRSLAVGAGVAGLSTEGGIISSAVDQDYYTFTLTVPSLVQFAVLPDEVSPNLNLLLELQDANGNVIRSTGAFSIRFGVQYSSQLLSGVYYLRVKGVGGSASGGTPPNYGYSDYGSIGKYRLSIAPTSYTAPSIQSQPVSGTVLVGAASSFTVGASGNPQVSYQWKRNGVALVNDGRINGATFWYLTINNTQITDRGVYTVEVSNFAGSVVSVGAELAVATPPPANPYLVRSSYSINLDGFMSLEVQNPGLSGTETYQWFRNGAAIPGATFSSLGIYSPTPSDLGEYYYTTTNASGTSASDIVTVDTDTVRSHDWIQAREVDGIGYFLFRNTPRIARYDIAAEAWLPDWALPGVPDSFAISDDSVFVAYGASVKRYSRSFGNQVDFATIEAPVTHLEIVGSALVAVFPTSSSRSDIVSLNRTAGGQISILRTVQKLDKGFSYSASTGRLYGRSSNTSPGNIGSVRIELDGTIHSQIQSPYHGAYSEAIRTIPISNGTLVADNAGIIYNASDLVYNSSFGGPVRDVVDGDAGEHFVLSARRVSRFDSARRQAASKPIGIYAVKMVRKANALLVFAQPETSTATPQVEKVLLGDLAPPVAAAAVDPMRKRINPSSIFLGDSDIVYLYSQAHRNIFRWSANALNYGPSIPLASVPRYLAFSSENQAIYFSERGAHIRKLPLGLSSPVEEPFFTTEGDIRSLEALGTHPFYGYIDRHYLLSATGARVGELGSTGALLQQSNPLASGYAWDSVRKRLYFFKTNSSGSLVYEAVSNNVLIRGAEGPSLGQNNAIQPIRVSANGAGIVIGSGQIFNADDLAVGGQLANAFVDAVWTDKIHTIRSSGAGTELQTWSVPGYTLERSRTIIGVPLRIFALSGGRLLVITAEDGYLQFVQVSATDQSPLSHIDTTATVVPTISAHPLNATVTTGQNASFHVVAAGGSLSYEWRKNGYNLANGGSISGATSATLTITGVQSADAGSYDVVVRNRAGFATSNTATLTANGSLVPPVITSRPSSRVVAVGGSTTLTLGATGATSYVWKRNGVVLGGTNTNEITRGSVVLGDRGLYEVTATNAAGSVRTLFNLNVAQTGALVAGWGDNSFGQVTIPAGVTNVAQVSAGVNHSLALKDDGTVAAWGANDFGQTVVPSGLNTAVQVSAGTFHSVALKSDGTVVAWGRNDQSQATVPGGLANVAMAYAGGFHTLALKTDGTIVGWGQNDAGQASSPSGLTNAVGLSAGTFHSLAVKSDGTVTAWGRNSDGQTSVPSGLTGVVAVAAGSLHSLALKSDGTVVAWGNNAFGQATVPSGLTGVVTISARTNHSMALKSDGTVVVWGNNANGQTTTPGGLGAVPGIAAGGNHNLAIVLPVQPVITGWTSATPTLGQTAFLRVRATGGGLSYQWRRAGSNLANAGRVSGVTTDTLTVTNVEAGDTDDYEVVVSNSAGSASRTVSLTVTLTSQPPVITARPLSRQIRIGNSTSLSVTATGATTYVWKRNGVAINVVPTLDIATATLADQGLYEVTVGNAAGSVRSLFYVGVSQSGAEPRAWGDNSFGQVTIPSGLTNVAQVAGGVNHSLALKDDGTVAAWGANDFNQTAVPSGLNTVVQVSAGTFHSVALKSDGTVVAWGRNDQGQATVPSGLTSVVTVYAGGFHTLALKADGTVVGWGQNDAGQAAAPSGLTNAVGLSAGTFHSLAVKSDGTVTAWGRNSDGQTSVPSGLTGVVAVAAGSLHSLALKSDGTVVAWGNNGAGQASVPSGLSGVVAISARTNHSFALKSDGTVVVWGNNANGQATVPGSLGTASGIAAGGNHNLAIVPPAVVVAPAITTHPSNATITAGQNASFAVVASGTAPSYQWRKGTSNLTNGGVISGATSATLTLTGAQTSEAGDYNVVVTNSAGSATSNTATLTVNAAPALPVITSRPASRQVAAGGSTTLTLGVTGATSYVWKRNGVVVSGATTNELAISSAALSDRGLYEVTATNAAGSVRTLFGLSVSQSGAEPKAWGDNSFGQVTIPSGLTNVAQVAGGVNHSVALKDDGTVAAWGANDFNQTAVPSGLNTAVQVSAGTFHSVALKSDGTVVAWGRNDQGQATVPGSLTNVAMVYAGGFHTLALKTDGTVVGWGQNDAGQAASPAGLTNAVGLSAGTFHSLAVKNDGTVTAWGRNSDGQTSVPSGLTGVVAVAAGSLHSLALKSNGTVVAWGNNGAGQASVPSGLTGVVAISARTNHSFALKSDGTVVVWGNNANGQTTVPGSLGTVTGIAAGGNHNLAIVPPAVVVAPAITSHPSNATITAGQNASFAVVASGTAPSYQWRKGTSNLTNGGVISGATSATLTLTGAQTSEAGDYNVVVTNSAGSATSNTATLTVNAAPALPVVTSRPASRLVAAGGSTTLTLGVTGATSYVWKRNGAVVSSATTNELVVSSAALSDRGLYEVTATNAAGSVRTLFGLSVSQSGAEPKAWGDNSFGQVTIPSGLTNIAQVAAGVNHSVALKDDGTVAVWGANDFNQTAVPSGLNTVVQMSAGTFHSVALKSDGTVVAWGRNDQGQATVPSGLTNVAMVYAGGFHTLALKTDGTIVGWGQNDAGQAAVPSGLTTAVGLSAGTFHSLAVKSDGTVTAWGRNSDAQTSVPSGLTGVVAVAAGSLHSLALKSNGTVVAWGNNANGQTTVPTGLSGVVAISARTNHSFALKSDGTVVVWGNNANGQTTVPGSLGTVSGIAAGGNHNLAIVPPAVVVAPAITSHPSNATITAGQNASFAVVASGTAPSYQWRKGTSNLTNGGVISGATSATLTLTGAQTSEAGDYNVVVTNSAGSATSNTATLTVNAAPALPVVTSRQASTMVAIAGGTTVGVTATGATSYVWRRNGVVESWTGNTLNISSAGPTNRGLYEVTASNSSGSVRSLFYVSVSQVGDVKAWGDNSLGQVTVPSGLTNVAQVAAGVNHSLALKDDGTVAAWGANDFNQTAVPSGLNTAVQLSAGTFHSVALKSDGTVVAWGRNDQGQATVPGSLANVAMVYAGGFHTLALKTDGTIVGWGQNDAGQAASPSGLTNAVGLSAGTFHSLAVKSDGTVTAWGRNSDGQTSVPSGLTGVVAVAAGSLHSLALKSDGTVVAWGNNGAGQASVPSGLTGVVAISARTNHSFALKSDGTVVVWGNNANGQTTVPGSLGTVSGIAAGGNHNVVFVPSTVAVPVQPAITTQPVSQSIIVGQTATFSVTASGGFLNYQWRKGTSNLTNGGVISGATSTSLTLTGAQTGDAGDYNVVVTNNAGSATSNNATLTVNPAPVLPVITSRQASTMVAVAGGTSVGVTASNATSYVWRINGVVESWITGSTLNISSAGPTNRGLYEVTASNSSGSVRSLFYVSVSQVGDVKAWGDNSLGQVTVPSGLTNVAQVAAGVNHSLALKDDGTVAAWGANDFNQTAVPSGLNTAVQLSAGTFHSVALKSDGTVVAWGRNDQGQATVPGSLTNVAMVYAGGFHTLALKTDGTIVGWGQNDAGQAAAPSGLTTAVGLSAGTFHSLAVRNDGTVTAWGRNSDGQTSVPSGLTGVVAVAAGSLHSLALKSDGTVVAWGNNGAGQASVPSGLTGVVAISARTNHSVALKSDGTVVVWGNNANGQTTVPGSLGTVSGIAAGGNHNLVFVPSTVAVPVQPAITTQPVSQTITVGQNVTFSVVASGGFLGYQWRKGTSNLTNGGVVSGATSTTLTLTGAQTGDAGDYNVVVTNSAGSATSNNATLTVNAAPVLPVITSRPASTTLVVGSSHSLTVGATGATSYVWKRNGEVLSAVTTGTISFSSPTLADAGLYEVTVSSGSGSVRSLFHVNVFGSHVLRVWGDSSLGQTTIPSGLTPAGQISAGVTHTLALKSDFTVAAWGGNDYAQRTVPSGLTLAVAVSAGTFHSVALKSDGTVVAWGRNDQGQATVPSGLANVAMVYAGGFHTLALKTDGTIVGWGQNDAGQAAAPSGLTNAVGLSAGTFHSLAVKSDGTVTAWGRNSDGQTSVPSGLTGVVAVAAGSLHSLALKSDGTVAAWGNNSFGQATVPSGLTGVVAISARTNHSVALKSDGTVVVWGNNTNGQTTVPGNVTGASRVASGGNHNVALVQPTGILPDSVPLPSSSMESSDATQSDLSAIERESAGLTHAQAWTATVAANGLVVGGNPSISISGYSPKLAELGFIVEGTANPLLVRVAAIRAPAAALGGVRSPAIEILPSSAARPGGSVLAREGSLESAVSVPMEPGRHYALVTTADGSTEMETLEISTVVTNPGVGTLKLSNVVIMAPLASGSGSLTLEFTVGGTELADILFLGRGASLGLPGPLAEHPQLSLYDASDRLIARNQGWGASSRADEMIRFLQQSDQSVTVLDRDDAGLLLRLQPGRYTIDLSADGPGMGLLEIQFGPHSAP